MTKLLQINITANWGSHGKIAEGIGKLAISQGWESYIAYGRWYNPSSSTLFHIGSMLDEKIHGVFSRLFDVHGLLSRYATKRLTKYIDAISPDIIHIHNVHGYYLNYPILFKFLAQRNIPIVWTLHDCWAYTGHCAHYMYIHCNKWQTHCKKCPQKETYPKSILLDNSYHNFELKKKYFLLPNNLTIVPVSKWLENDVKLSFLKDKSIKQIYNGIDISTFKPDQETNSVFKKYNIPIGQEIILGVASNWFRKGLGDFIHLSEILDEKYTIILVGLNEHEIHSIPKNIIGIKRTQNIKELIKLYSVATVFFNPTWEDNFPTTNIEALACGTPVITYKTGGSPEVIDDQNGFVIEKGNVEQAKEKISLLSMRGKSFYSKHCRNTVVNKFNKEDRFLEYFHLYCNLLKKK